MNNFCKLCVLALALFGTGVMQPARAEDYPNKPIKVIVPYAAGSGVDLIARVMAAKLQKELQQPIVVDNRPGAEGRLGSAVAAKSPPDGYTLLMAGSGTHSSINAIYKKVPYDVEKDFQPISNLIDADFFLVVRADSKVNSIKELLAWLKANQSKASFGFGSVTTQVAGMSFIKAVGVQVPAVPYKSNGVALNDLLGGQIDFMFVDQTVGLPQIAGGKVTALAVASKQRRPDMPQVPTAIEQGIDMTIDAWVGLVAPAGISSHVLDKLSTATANALKDPHVRERLAASGRVMSPMTPNAFAAYMKNERAAWEAKVRSINLQQQ